MSAESEAFKRRTFVFAVGVGRLLRTLSRIEPGPTAQRQLAKSSSSTAANYRAACRGRSHAEFTAKLGVSAEECDETMFWLEYAEAGELTESPALKPLIAECGEILAILSKSVGTARRNERDNRG